MVIDNQVSLYFHIPFCTKKCPYCHFYVIPNRLSHHAILGEALSLEWERQLPKLHSKQIVSIYFGGGTPSLFAPKGISEILNSIHKNFSISSDCEITIEANPEEAHETLFKELRHSGVNRLSLGVQSLDDRSLQTLERTHNALRAKKAINDANTAGFSNITIDLMYDLPEQTLASWDYTLDQITSLPIQHLSLYNLTIEPHTVFFKRKNSLILPPQESSLYFLNSAVKKLTSMGLNRYEISAFAKPGFESVHNLGYWEGRPFLGFGPSAFSHWEGERFQNIANLHRYYKLLKEGSSPIAFKEKLTFPQNIKEKIVVALRLLKGVEIPPNIYTLFEPQISSLITQKLLFKNENIIQLSPKGLLFHDYIASELI